MKISVIVPVLNEAACLPFTLKQLQPLRQLGHEVIVVDGGSTDSSLTLAEDSADCVVISKPGRAIQMNYGASVASGDVFLFLHADTILPNDAKKLITSRVESYFWGYFSVRLSSKKLIFRIIGKMISWRSRWSSIATGDQAIFVERNIFNAIGGFPEIELMEDIAISRLLKNERLPVVFKSTVLTSNRRWEKRGVVSTVLLMWQLRFLYFFGVSPKKLNQMYR